MSYKHVQYEVFGSLYRSVTPKITGKTHVNRRPTSVLRHGSSRPLFVLGLVTDVVGSDALSYARREVVVADVEAHARLRRGVVRRERAQRARRQRIVIARVSGAGAAGHDWYIMRLNHVLKFEQHKVMLAWGKQTLIECMHSRG